MIITIRMPRIIIKIITATHLTRMHVELLRDVVMVIKISDSILPGMPIVVVVVPKVAIITSVGEMMRQRKILALLVELIVSIHFFLYIVMKI